MEYLNKLRVAQGVGVFPLPWQAAALDHHPRPRYVSVLERLDGQSPWLTAKAFLFLLHLEY